MFAIAVSDWTNIAVALGTLLLAFATFSATAIARRSTKEAYRSRVDALAPRLLVVDLKVQEGVEKPETVTAGNFGFAKSGEPIDVAGLGDGKLGLFIVLDILNEGNSTAHLALDCPHDIFVRESTYLFSSPGRIELRYANDVILLQPQARVSVKLVWRQSATVWSLEPDFPNRLPTRRVEVQLRDATGSVLDKCEVAFGGYALMPTPSKPGGWNVAPRNLFTVIPQGGSNTYENIGSVVRNYPKERTSAPPWSKLQKVLLVGRAKNA
jgi:hypothetical protein